MTKRAVDYDFIAPGSFAALTAEAQAARDLFQPGITFRDEQGKVTEVALTADRVVEALDRVRARVFGAGK